MQQIIYKNLNLRTLVILCHQADIPKVNNNVEIDCDGIIIYMRIDSPRECEWKLGKNFDKNEKWYQYLITEFGGIETFSHMSWD